MSTIGNYPMKSKREDLDYLTETLTNILKMNTESNTTKKFDNLMIDIETFGTDLCSVVLSIAATPFNETDLFPPPTYRISTKNGKNNLSGNLELVV